jgi:hypothetical protein
VDAPLSARRFGDRPEMLKGGLVTNLVDALPKGLAGKCLRREAQPPGDLQ